MSLLADKDFLLHSLQLNYVRHVLPNHALQSAIPGTGPHNLIAFDHTSPTFNSPYVVLSGLTDEAKWPELSSGRSSPPLALGFGRGESGAGGRRRAPPTSTGGGTTGLNYSQTIVAKGRGVGGAGMRVGGRQRSWKGRGGALEVDEKEENELVEPPEVQEATTENLNRRNSLEASIHRKRLQDNTLHLQAPPPVIIHSPVRTPQDSPVSTVDPSRANTPPTPPPPEQRPIAVPVELTAAAALLEASEAAAEEEARRAYDAPPLPPSETASSIETPSSLPLSHITESSDLSTSAPLALMHPHSHSSSSISVSPIHPSSSPSSVPEPSTSARFASVASSGVSLFGVSRMTATSEGVMGRERSDSDSSSFAPGSTNTRIEAIEEDEEDDELQPPPPSPPPPPPATTTQFQPPRNFRARERRRVNISGRMLVPIAEPAHEEEAPSVPAAISTAGQPDSPGRPRANTDPIPPVEGEVAKEVEPVGDGGSTERKRKVSAPTLLLSTDNSAAPDPPPAPSAPSSAPASPPQHLRPKPQPPPAPAPAPPHTPSRSHPPLLTFSKLSPLAPPSTAAPKRSALTALLATSSSSSTSSNPFSRLYASLISRASDALKLTIYFPHSKVPSKGLKVGVRRDVSVEEVIGVGLWKYWEEGWEPELELKGDAEEDGEETIKWNLRIVEDEGEVDEDFPALDRTRAISKFSFDEFAIVPATGAQLKDNQSKQSTIQRRPSRVLAGPKRSFPIPTTTGATTLAPPLPSDAPAPSSPAGGGGASFRPGTTMGVSSALAIPVLLRVRLPPAPGVDEINTTVSVPNDMYMSDVLDHICKKRGLENPKEWALMVRHNEADIVVPLDRTVDSLGDRHDLTLVRRSQVASLRGNVKQALQNTNPSASIFKRLSEPPQPKYQSASDLTSTYLRFNVQRKLPMPLGRHPRTIAIDGDYIHFMPSASDNRGRFEGGRTSSFHISMVHDCKVSRRAPMTFKMLVQKNGHEKRYDFEAESARQAVEIVQHVKALMASFKVEEAARRGMRLQM